MTTASAGSKNLRTTAWLLVLLLSSCAAPPIRPMPLEDLKVPIAWSAVPTPAGQVRKHWWREFDAKEIEGLVWEALAANHDLRRAASRVDASAAMAGIAGAELLPVIRGGVSAGRAKSSLGGRSVTANRFDASLEVSWAVDLWGRLRAQQRGAENDLEATKSDLYGAQVSIAAQVVKTWLAAAESRLQLRLAERTVVTYRASLATAERRFTRGLAPPLEVRLASANLAAATALVALRKRQLDRTTRRLEILLGRYPSGQLTVVAHLPPVPPSVPAGLPSSSNSR
ncbi:TolC family protein [Planctomycetota bacterium]